MGPVNSDSLLEVILPKLDRGGSPDGRFPDRKGEYWALCPFHHDTHAQNFSVSAAGYKCFACGKSGGLRDLAAHLTGALVQLERGGTTHTYLPPTLENYARVKGLPLDFLDALGLQTAHSLGKPYLKMPYYDAAGTETGVRLRVALTGENRFRWRRGAKIPTVWALAAGSERPVCYPVRGGE